MPGAIGPPRAHRDACSQIDRQQRLRVAHWAGHDVEPVTYDPLRPEPVDRRRLNLTDRHKQKRTVWRSTAFLHITQPGEALVDLVEIVGVEPAVGGNQRNVSQCCHHLTLPMAFFDCDGMEGDAQRVCLRASGCLTV